MRIGSQKKVKREEKMPPKGLAEFQLLLSVKMAALVSFSLMVPGPVEAIYGGVLQYLVLS